MGLGCAPGPNVESGSTAPEPDLVNPPVCGLPGL